MNSGSPRSVLGEVPLFHAQGKFHLGVNLVAWFAGSTAGVHEAPLTHEIAIASQRLTLQSNPADRFLVATAQVLDLTLVTADNRLLGLGTIKTLANR